MSSKEQSLISQNKLDKCSEAIDQQSQKEIGNAA
jgi:hypothetical protein